MVKTYTFRQLKILAMHWEYPPTIGWRDPQGDQTQQPYNPEVPLNEFSTIKKAAKIVPSPLTRLRSFRGLLLAGSARYARQGLSSLDPHGPGSCKSLTF